MSLYEETLLEKLYRTFYGVTSLFGVHLEVLLRWCLFMRCLDRGVSMVET